MDSKGLDSTRTPSPGMIKLFNDDWIPTTKDTNDKIYSAGSGIMKTLESGSPRVDACMTWAARRKTTRAEDVAYSLMGIFDLSLQIACGEAGDRAFCRLIEVIMQAGGPSVLNWNG
ncbi:hypothetical protein M405DRAFT_894208, partial [Rhizopogon salebrosus TDB-379]